MRIRPKKSLGQNFLIDKNVVGKILDALELKPNETLLEIGSGKGDITSLIAPCVKKLYAVEIDRRIFSELSLKAKEYPNLESINSDILKCNIAELPLDKGAKLKVFGNIPYYISTPIINRLISFRDFIERVYITVQAEFAERLTALPGNKDYGSLTCYVQYYAFVRRIFTIKKNSFYPVPKVDSCLLGLEFRKKPLVFVTDEKKFFSIIRAAFGQRRKKLSNNLKGHLNEDILKVFFAESNISPNARAEELSLQDFAYLANLAV